MRQSPTRSEHVGRCLTIVHSNLDSVSCNGLTMDLQPYLHSRPTSYQYQRLNCITIALIWWSQHGHLNSIQRMGNRSSRSARSFSDSLQSPHLAADQFGAVKFVIYVANDVAECTCLLMAFSVTTALNAKWNSRKRTPFHNNRPPGLKDQHTPSWHSLTLFRLHA